MATSKEYKSFLCAGSDQIKQSQVKSVYYYYNTIILFIPVSAVFLNYIYDNCACAALVGVDFCYD